MNNFARQHIDVGKLPESVVRKWSSEILLEGFVPFPKRLLRCMSELFEGEHAIEDLAVILAIVDYRRPSLIRFPSIEYLSFLAGLSPEVFRERLAELQDRRLITVHGSEGELIVEIDGLMKRIEELTGPQKWEAGKE